MVNRRAKQRTRQPSYDSLNGVSVAARNRRNGIACIATFVALVALVLPSSFPRGVAASTSSSGKSNAPVDRGDAILQGSKLVTTTKANNHGVEGMEELTDMKNDNIGFGEPNKIIEGVDNEEINATVESMAVNERENEAKLAATGDGINKSRIGVEISSNVWSEVGTNTELFSNWKKIADPENRVKSGPSRHSNSADSIAVAFGLDQSIEYVAWSAKEDNLDAFGLEDKARGRKDETVEKYGNDKPDINKSDENEQGQRVYSFVEWKEKDPMRHLSSCNDSNERFEVDGFNEKQSCKWASRRDTLNRCNEYPEVRLHCPNTCRLDCGTYEPSKITKKKGKGKGKTSSPSSNPSSTPSSQQPSSGPSVLPSSQPSSSPSVCMDEPGWVVGGNSLFSGMNCTDIEGHIEGWCDFIQNLSNSSYDGKSISEACCDCDGGDHQTTFPSLSPTNSPSISQHPSMHAYPSVAPSSQPSVCVDESDWYFLKNEDGVELGCDWLGNNAHLCEQFESLEYKAKTVSLACCICGGGDHQSVSPSESPTTLPSSEPSQMPSVSVAPSDQPSRFPSISPTDIPSAIPSTSPSVSMKPSQFPSMSFGSTFDGEPCNHPRECKERPLFPTEAECQLRDKRFPNPDYDRRRLNSIDEPQILHRKRSKKTKSPSQMPSSLPTSAPTALPTSRPSELPTSEPSLLPSTSPSDQPSLLPSSSPSLQPSRQPSSEPSMFPSSSPSTNPSSEPSTVPTISMEPTLSPTGLPSLIPSDRPSISAEPSMEPTLMRANGTCINKLCEAQELHVTFSNSTLDEIVSATYDGSYGNGARDGTYDQDFTGGVVVGPAHTITLFGNAWKAYKLDKPYTVTRDTRLKFHFAMLLEAEGHAICIDNDKNEDTFGGARIRCFMLGGSEMSSWDHVKKLSVFGPNRTDLCASEEIDISIGDFFSENGATINYISFIQDNDASPDVGESAFESITLYEEVDDNFGQLTLTWNETSSSSIVNFQGGTQAYELVGWHLDDGVGGVWRATIDGLTISIEECYGDMNAVDNLKCLTANSDDFEDVPHVPNSISIALTGTAVVGFQGYQEIVPSNMPSNTPTTSLVPSTGPTKAPTKSPSSTGTRRRLQEDRDIYGKVVIYSTGVHEMSWKNNNVTLYGESENTSFGASAVISRDGLTVAVGSPQYPHNDLSKTGKVQIYVLQENEWRGKGVEIEAEDGSLNFGARIGLSDDGNAVVIVATDKTFIYEWTTDGTWAKIPAENTVPGNGVSIDVENLILHVLGGDGTRNSFKLIGTCADENANALGQSREPLKLQCQCREGFLSSATGLTRILRQDDSEEKDFCVPAMTSMNVITTASDITFRFDSDVTIVGETSRTPKIDLLRLDPDNRVEINIFEENKWEISNDNDSKYVILKELRPGYRYITTIEYTTEDSTTTVKEESLTIAAVASCSCNNTLIDISGRPQYFEIYQDRGHVMFRFQDNSYCEDAFSFTRVDTVDEFLRDFAANASSFTSDFYFSASENCFTTIEPGTQASDDLAVSNLEVGKEYSYCVRAVKQGHYMDAPYENSEQRRLLTSSGSSCEAHKIRWEASIHGRVTTIPTAGSLPIKDVLVSWELLSKDSKKILECDNCSGSTLTNEGGTFNIEFNADHLFLDNESDFPVRVFFSKTSPGDLKHDFLCDLGTQELCDPEEGYITYLNHLQFMAPLNVYDDTSVPVSGKVFVADTKFEGSDGCAIESVEVCLYHNMTGGWEQELVCVDTETDGSYLAPVIVGATVSYVELSYYGHTFEVTDKNPLNGEDGILISAEDQFIGFDYKDVSKAKLTVEVAGGQCNDQLGTSFIQTKVVGCDWPGWNTGETYSYKQSGWTNEYSRIPAHEIEVQVIDIQNEGKNRIKSIWNSFQGTDPEIRNFDLLESVVSENKDAEDSIDEEDIVRFEYEGTLMMEVTVDMGDNLDCDNYDKGEDMDSFHVVESAKLFNVRVDLKMDLKNGRDPCDIVDDDYKIQFTNQVGNDDFGGWEEFLAKIEDERKRDALLLCSPTAPGEGPCTFNVTHTEDNKGNKIGDAGFNATFLAGRPNIQSPYTRSIFIQATGGSKSKTHTATFFVEGLYKLEGGSSFALPTHEPVMILRDPPGSNSYAQYQNIETQLTLLNAGDTLSTTGHFNFQAGWAFGTEVDACTGACVLACAIICTKTFQASGGGTLGFGVNAGTNIVDKTKSSSNYFSTTWSYTTSTDASLAGPQSDVFVVPNLNVAYDEVIIAEWNNTSCKPILENEGTPDEGFPSRIEFDVNSDSTKPAFSYYSRYFIDKVKIPELEMSVDKLRNLTSNMNAGDPTYDENKANLRTVEDGLKGWRRAMDIDKNREENSIVNWFDSDAIDPIPISEDSLWQEFFDLDGRNNKDSALGKVGGIFSSPNFDVDDPSEAGNLPKAIYDTLGLDNRKERLKISGQSSALAPETLIGGAKSIPGVSYGTVAGADKLEETRRIQFSGASGTYKLSMSKERVESFSRSSCWLGCNKDLSLDVDGSLNLKAIVFGGGEGTFSGGLQIHYTHSSVRAETETEKTTITFGLGDKDKGDEFVVDISFDERYGTLIFDTVLGVSKCPQEEGTAANEDPGIEFASALQSPYIFPDDPMIFEVQLSNRGKADSSTFSLTASQGESNLGIKVDGSKISSSGVAYTITNKATITKQIAVTRGPQFYKNAPIVLYLSSQCGDASKKRNLTLYNMEDDDGQYIEFLKPCPKVHWDGELARDRGFLINKETNLSPGFNIGLLNPDAGADPGSFAEKVDAGELKNVFFKYRRVGEVLWTYGLTPDGSVMDFAADYTIEESDGTYLSLPWRPPITQEGEYEVVVETECEKFGRQDVDGYSEQILTGVIDLTPPEQYGQPLPLREEVILGEEVSVLFTEPLDCGMPLSFDIKVDVLGTPAYTFGKDELQVICEGRRVGFQIDLTFVPFIANILGRQFRVEIGKIENELSRIKDLNGNERDPNKENVGFTRTFGDLDLVSAGASFRLLMRDLPCGIDTSGTDLSKEVASEIASIVGLSDSKRISFSEIQCVGKDLNEVSTRAHVSSTDNDRHIRHRGLKSDYNDKATIHSVDIFSKIRDSANLPNRKLNSNREPAARSIEVSALRILPCISDLDKFKTHPDNVEEELRLNRIASIETTDGAEISADYIELEHEMEDMRKAMDAMRQSGSAEEEDIEDIKSILLKLDEGRKDDMKNVFVLSAVIMISCMCLLFAVFLHLRR